MSMRVNLLYVLAGILLSSLLTYMSARILFPDMGLGVPEYHKFLIVSTVVIPLAVVYQVFGFVIRIMRESK